MKTISTNAKAMQFEGVPQLIKTIHAVGLNMSGEGASAYTEKLKDICMKPANVIADEARDLVPVVTGKLKAGIFAAPLKARVGAIAGVHGVHYAPFVEYGTVRATAQPFLRPAVNATRPLIANMMAGDLKALIEEVSKDNAWHASGGGVTQS